MKKSQIKRNHFKNVVIIDDGQFGRLPYSRMKKYDKVELRNAYRQFFLEGEKQGLKLYKANVAWFNKKTKLFDKGWEIKDGKWKICHGFGYDFIFDRTKLTKKNLKIKRLFRRGTKVLHPMELEKLCSDKWLTYNKFRSKSPKSFLVHNRKQLTSKFKKIKSDLVVLKPQCGSSGTDIVITTRDKLPLCVGKNTLLQEFIDTSQGVPNLVKGIHDIRSIIINGKYMHSVIRVPAKGYISNISRGGKAVLLTKRRTPRKLIKFVMGSIDNNFRNIKPRFYTVDCFFDRQGRIYLIEMNSKPAFFFYDSFRRKDLKRLIITNLLKAIKDSI